jgi:hypothetical protein
MLQFPASGVTTPVRLIVRGSLSLAALREIEGTTWYAQQGSEVLPAATHRIPSHIDAG